MSRLLYMSQILRVMILLMFLLSLMKLRLKAWKRYVFFVSKIPMLMHRKASS